jgi:hypothetical protein
VVGVERQPLVEIGAQADGLARARRIDGELDDRERHVLDLHPPRLDRGDEPVAAVLGPLQRRGEELDEGRPRNARALVVPLAVRGDAHGELGLAPPVAGQRGQASADIEGPGRRAGHRGMGHRALPAAARPCAPNTLPDRGRLTSPFRRIALLPSSLRHAVMNQLGCDCRDFQLISA